MQWWCAAQGVAWTWSWRPYPGVWAFVGLLAVGLAYLHRRFPSAEGAPGDGASSRSRLRGAAAAAGVLTLWVALDWPVGALGAGYLASVHGLQFLLIALVAPPFLLLGIPAGAWQRFGDAVRGRPPGAWLSALTHPVSALALFTAVMALTHWPPVVDTLMVDQLGSFALDMLWLAAGLLFWWPVAAPVPRRPWLTLPVKIGHLLAAMMVDTGVFAFLVFNELPVYATFELAPPVAGIGKRDDQMVAGFLMKLGGAVVFWTAITILFFRWVAQSEREEPAARPAH